MRDEQIREYAQRKAQGCIEDWSQEGWYEMDEEWGTDFSEEELNAIAYLASKAIAVLPSDDEDE